MTARHVLLSLAVFLPLGALLLVPPIRQPESYHLFADQRSWLGVQNFMDFGTNLPFLIAGASGLWLSSRRSFQGSRLIWFCFFAGVALTSLGSAYYHWSPTNETLLWDRLPLTIVFSAMVVALLDEFVSHKAAGLILIPALVFGVASAAYWHGSGDLRLYIWVQVAPMLAIPLVLALFKSRFTHSRWLWLLLVCYGGAKVAELADGPIFAVTSGVVSGHSLKHLLAAVGCFVILNMLRRRSPSQPLVSEVCEQTLALARHGAILDSTSKAYE